MDDFKNAVDLIEENKKQESIPNSLIEPLYNEQAFVENKSGKDGVGAESLASTFNSVMQGKDIAIKKITPDGEVDVSLSINTENGVLKLTHFSKANVKSTSLSSTYKLENGELVEMDSQERSIADNISNLQSEAVDNAKSGRLGKGNLNNFTFSAANTFLQLQDVSDEKGKSPSVNHLVFLLTQNSILDFVKEMETINDTTIEDFESDKKGKIIKGILDNYYNKAKVQPSYELVDTYSLPSEKELFRLSTLDKTSKEYNVAQAEILKFFLQLESLGNAMRDVMTSLNSDTKGSGKSLINANIRLSKYSEIEDNNKLSVPWTSSEKVYKITGVDSIGNDSTQQGVASDIALKFLDELFGQFYIYKKPASKRMLQLYAAFTNKPSVNSIGETGTRSLFNGFKSYLLNSSKSNMFDYDVKLERERLFKSKYDITAPMLKGTNEEFKKIEEGKSTVFVSNSFETGVYQLPNGIFINLEEINGTPKSADSLALSMGYASSAEFKLKDPYNEYFKGDKQKGRKYFRISKVKSNITEPSLARRLFAVKKLLPNNYLLKRLTPDLSNNINKELDLIKYNAAVTQNVDDIENTKAFVKMLISKNETIKEFASDLIKYFYLTGGVVNAQSFGQYIPSSLLINSEFAQGLQDIENSLESNEEVKPYRFIKQYFQNNPYKAIKIAEDQVKKVLNFKTNQIVISKSADKRTKYQNELFITNPLEKEEALTSGIQSLNIPFPFVYLYDKRLNTAKLYELSETEDSFVYNQISLLGTSKLGSSEYSFSDNNHTSIIKNNLPVNQRIEDVYEEKNKEKEQEPTNQGKAEITSDIIEKYGLTEDYSDRVVQTILNQAKSSQNEDFRVLASILEKDSNVTKTKIRLNNSIDVAGRANAFSNEVQFKTDDLESIRFNTIRSKTNTDDYNFQVLALHELLHIATSAQYNLYSQNKELVNEKQRRVFEQLDKLKDSVINSLDSHNIIINGEKITKAGFEQFSKKYNSNGAKDYSENEVSVYYGLLNTKEFITASMTDPNMQNLLNQIKYSGDKSLFDRLKDLISRFLDAVARMNNVKINNDSVLKEAVSNIIDLISDDIQSKTSSTIEKMSDLTNHSGGAYGGDTFWDIIGRKFGVINHKHYREAANSNLSQSLKNSNVKATIVSKEDLEKARKQIEILLGKKYPDTTEGNLQVRNYYQVANSDAVFAIATLKPDNKSVTGGTNTAVQLGISLNKPTYVWDIATEQWYVFNSQSFEKTETPILTKDFAGVGSRDIESYNTLNKQTGKWEPRKEYLGKQKEEAAKKAIEEVYQKTKDSLNNNVKTVKRQPNEFTPENITSLKPNEEPNFNSSKTDFNSLNDKVQRYNNIIKKLPVKIFATKHGNYDLHSSQAGDEILSKSINLDDIFTVSDKPYVLEVHKMDAETKYHKTNLKGKFLIIPSEKVYISLYGNDELGNYDFDYEKSKIIATANTTTWLLNKYKLETWNDKFFKKIDLSVLDNVDLNEINKDSLIINGITLDSSTIKDGKIVNITLNKDQLNAVQKFADYFDSYMNGKTPNKMFRLIGAAGRGKTMCAKIMLQYIKKKSNRVAQVITPTHKAGKVASRAVFNKSNMYKTAASVIASFKKGNPPKFTLAVMDEISMLNDIDAKYMTNKFSDYGIFTILMGDKYQLPPINKFGGNKISWFFENGSFDDKNSVELSKPERFGEGSEIFKLTEHVRENINRVGGGIIAYGDTNEIKTLTNKSEVASLFVKYYNQGESLVEKAKTKIIAYGNATVDGYNTLVRKLIFGADSEQAVVEGDILVGKQALGISPQPTNVENSEDYVVQSIQRNQTKKLFLEYRKKEYSFDLNVDYLMITTTDAREDDRITKNISWLDISKPENKEFAEFLFVLNKEKASLDQDGKYDSAANNMLQYIESQGIAIPNSLYKVDKTGAIMDFKQLLAYARGNSGTQEKAMDMIESALNENKITEFKGNVAHGYAITAHTSQGSTYDNVIVDEKNISFREERRKVLDRDGKQFSYEANNMRYVAFSRAAKKLYVYSDKIASEMIYDGDNALTKSETFETKNLDDFLKTLTAGERIAFFKLKKENIIKTSC